MTFRVIPGLNQASELGEAVLPPEITRKAAANLKDFLP